MAVGGFPIDLVSDAPGYLTSRRYLDQCEKMKQTLDDLLQKRSLLTKRIKSLKAQSRSLQAKRNRWRWVPFSESFLKARNEKLQETMRVIRSEVDAVEAQFDPLYLNVNVSLRHGVRSKHDALCAAFSSLVHAHRLWDVVESEHVDKVTARSFASSSIERKDVHFDESSFSVVRSELSVLHLSNANGADIYFYPTFILVGDHESQFALMHYADVSLKSQDVTFVEQESIPGDARVVGNTWAKVNKDGTPDRRFKGNYEIPIVEYELLTIESPTGLREAYLVSNSAVARAFAKAFDAYKRELLTK
ncbi:MAG: hypothetical protein WD768_20835 [Phycisphaeraceae bacterium]